MPDQNDQTTVGDQPQAPPAKQDQGAGAESQLSPEELEWQKLKGSTQNRFRTVTSKLSEVARENEELKNKLAEKERIIPPSPPAFVPEPETITDEQRLAVERIRNKFGFTTKDDVKQEMSKVMSVLEQFKNDEIVETEYKRLEDLYDGKDGRPAFDRVEVEEYMKSNGVYQPEVAYEALYKEELLDWEVARRGGKQPQDETKPYSEKPTHSATSGSKPLTIEEVQQKLREPNGKEWWEKNRLTVLENMADLLK